MEDQSLIECKPQVINSIFGRKYDNPTTWKTWRRPGGYEFMKMKCKESNEAGIPSEDELDKTLPVHLLTEEGKSKLNNPPRDVFQIMWIGHATLLVQFDGITVLTDPVFLDRCSPVQLVGPKRYRPVPCTIEDLPDIDAVIISHNHYDHLEYNAVLKLNYRFGDKIRWFVPEGLKDWFMKYGCSNVKEMSWWQENKLNEENTSQTNFICVPAQHWSQRSPLDAMKSLWCGWVIKSQNRTFYYTGDTGYCPVFKQIGEKFGPIDLSAIPIGCYCPRYFMKPQHIDPEHAVIIHNEVKSKKSVAVHWGTFDGLGSHEFYLEPQRLLRKAVKDNELSDDDFFTVEHGHIKTIETDILAEPDSIELQDNSKQETDKLIEADNIELQDNSKQETNKVIEPDSIQLQDNSKQETDKIIEPDSIELQDNSKQDIGSSLDNKL